MFNSRIIDKSSSCNIIRHSLQDDLLKYHITNNNIVYNNNVTVTLSSKINNLTSLFPTDTPDKEVWQPIFLDNDNYIENKKLSAYGSYLNGNSNLNSGRIGIENFYKFAPQFKSWSVNGADMCIDWILNKSETYYAVYYGILGWYRLLDQNNPRSEDGLAQSIDKFPIGSRLITSTQQNKVFIKIDNNSVYDVSEGRTLNNEGWSFPKEDRRIINISTLGANLLFSLADKYLDPKRNEYISLKTLTNADGNNYHLWIPDGDFFAFFNTESEKDFALSENIGANSYVSASLYRSYSNIYRILTIDEPRFLINKNLRSSRAYKKLAHALSTSPFVTEFSINALDYIEIRKAVQEYIQQQAFVVDILTDMKILRDTLYKISKILQNTIVPQSTNVKDNQSLYLDTKPSFTNISNNYITNEEQLFNKLISKYGARLAIPSSSSVSIRLNPNTVNLDNQGIVITEIIDTYCDKGVTKSKLTNEHKIVFDDMQISAIGSETNNVMNIGINSNSTTSVPLADMAKPSFGLGSSINIRLDKAGYVAGTNRRDLQPYNPPATVETYIYETVAQDPNLIDNPDRAHADSSIDFYGLDILPSINSAGEVGLMYEDMFLESQITLLWEQISGPPGTFASNGIFTSFATGSQAVFKTAYTGQFIIQCTAITPFGNYKKQKTFFIINGADFNSSAPYGQYWNSLSRIWEYPPAINPNINENTPIYLNRDELRPMISQINRIGINNIAGVVWPIKTSMNVREDLGALGRARTESIFELSGLYKFKYPTNYTSKQPNASLALTYNTNNTSVKIHSIFLEKIRTNDPDCAQCVSFYEPLISAKQAIAFRQNPIEGQPNESYNVTRLNRTNKSRDTFLFNKYIRNQTSDKAQFKEHIEFQYPSISTVNSPSVLPYGGYNRELVNNFGSDIPYHPKPAHNSLVNSGILFSDNTSVVLPAVTGYKIDYTNDFDSSLLKLCYQKATPLVRGTGSVILLDKGVMHPNSGWIPYDSASYRIHANKSSVLKFNPGARDSFAFTGPAIPSISNRAIDITNNHIKPKIYTSTINLKLAKEVQWDPECSCGGEGTEGVSLQTYNDNQIHKEYIDIDPNTSNHGYRVLAGGIPKLPELTANSSQSIVNDEFLFSQDTDNKVTYSFAVTGPASPISEVRQSDGKIKIRDPRVIEFGIKDIEVKLNFLNYVNTKNLVVWLEVGLDTAESKSRFKPGRPPPSPYITQARGNQKTFLDEAFDSTIVAGDFNPNIKTVKSTINNDTLYQYIESLTSMNCDDGQTPFRLFLLNQEHIGNNSYNFSVKFSDSSSKYNNAYDLNIQPSPTGDLLNNDPNNIMTYMISNKLSYSDSYYSPSQSAINQNTIRTNQELQPTIAATGYSDRQTCFYHSILKHNKLNIVNNTFNKFITKSLFLGQSPDTGPCEGLSPRQKTPNMDGATSFKLCIMVLDESDDMNPSDTLNNQFKTGFDTVESKTSSAFIDSSLCNWELILHVGPVHKPTPRTNPDISSYGNIDILSLLNYTDPKYPGYTFIGDLSQHKHLLPIVNYNAPYACIADSSSCLENSNDPTKSGSIIRPPQFPTIAFIQIASAIAQGAAFGGGTVVGTLAGINGIINNPGFNAIFNWFREVQFARELENAGRQIYAPNYFKYPFGSPEKILLNFRKPGDLWHTAEATIFKYHNTPILKPNKYKFIRVKRGNGKNISDFKFKIVSDYRDLIDSNLYSNVFYECNKISSLMSQSLPAAANGVIIQNGDLVNLNLINESNPNDPACKTELYVVEQTPSSATPNWIKLQSDNPNDLCKSLKFLSHNDTINGGSQFLTKTLSDDIVKKKVIIIENRIAYDIFKINDQIESYDFVDRLEDNPASMLLNQILKKALIFKDNKYYSVFVLKEAITTQNTISSYNHNIFFVLGNSTSIEDKLYKQYNIWGMDHNKGSVVNTISSVVPNTHSLGSYGDGSPFLTKNILSNNINTNELQTSYSIFNNKYTDKLKYNKISIIDASGVAITGFNHSTCFGFDYSDRDINGLTFDTKDLCYYISPEYIRQTDGDSNPVFSKLKDQIKLSTTVSNDTVRRYAYIRAEPPASSSDQYLPLNINYGDLYIENDLIEYIPIKELNATDFDTIINRLKIIDDTSYSGVDNEVGIPESTTTVLQSNNLRSILKHYDQLPNDPTNCMRKDTPDPTLCYKQKTEQKINDLYIERKEILDLLDQQAIRTISCSYTDEDNSTKRVQDLELIHENNLTLSVGTNGIVTERISVASIDTTYPINKSYKSRYSLPITHPKYLDPKILPKIEPKIITDALRGSIRIIYQPINTEHYWINLDPTQSTFIDFESNPKILTETRYTCTLANPIDILTPTINNNICPFFFGTDGPVGKTANIEESYEQSSPGNIKYVIDPDLIEQQKQKLQSQFTQIMGWKKFTKERYFNINGDETNDISPNLEITVKSEEDYLIPVTVPSQKTSDLSGDSNFVPGIPPCQTNYGSPGGSGLIDSNGVRVEFPTRIMNICNLDNTNQIEVSVKRIPRLLRGVDLLATIYRYGLKSLYRQANLATPRIPNDVDSIGVGGSINNSLYYWYCFQRDPYTKQLQSASIPQFFQLQNEMIFRSFFGSVDKVENRTDILNSYYPWELIPYEYDKN